MKGSFVPVVLGVALALASGFSAAKTPKQAQPATWNAEPTSFMGITLGQPLADQAPRCPTDRYGQLDFQNIREGQLCADSASKEITDVWGTPALGFSYKTTVFMKSGKVSSIWLLADTAMYPAATALLTKRYGAPSRISEGEVQSTAGAKFANETAQWSGKKVSIRAIQRFDKVDQAAVIVEDIELRSRSTEEDNAKEDAAASKL